MDCRRVSSDSSRASGATVGSYFGPMRISRLEKMVDKLYRSDDNELKTSRRTD